MARWILRGGDPGGRDERNDGEAEQKRDVSHPPTLVTRERLSDHSACRYHGRAWRTRALLGAIAQLGERLDRTQEVGGSSPPSSTR